MEYKNFLSSQENLELTGPSQTGGFNTTQSTETPCGQRHSATQADTDTRKPHTNTTYDNNLAVGMYTSRCGGNQEISLTT